MTIRDIKILSEIIQNKIDLGIQLDSSILSDFEKLTKNKNFIFSSFIDFIYEIFNLDKNIKNKNFNKILKIIGKNKNLTNFLMIILDNIEFLDFIEQLYCQNYHNYKYLIFQQSYFF